MNTHQTILSIPGKWNNREEIVTSIVENNAGKFIFAGNILLNMQTKLTFEIDIIERDERMKAAFQFAGKVNRVTEDFLNEINEHKFVIYVIGETGSLDSALAIAEAGQAILNAGGIGLKVESAGKAFTKEHWASLLADVEEANLYQMFVVDSIADKRGWVFSCGMHNLGLKDTIVYNEDPQFAVQLISIFGYYQLIDKPSIKANETFSPDANSGVFIIEEEESQPYQGDELFGNPYGMWRLKRK